MTSNSVSIRFDDVIASLVEVNYLCAQSSWAKNDVMYICSMTHMHDILRNLLCFPEQDAIL